MKKRFAAIILIILVALPALSLTSCDIMDSIGDAFRDAVGSAAGDAFNSAAVGGSAVPSIQWLINGTYSFDYAMIIEADGIWLNNSGSLSADGGNLAMSGEMSIEGILVKMRVVHKDGKAYMIDEMNGIVIEIPPGEDDIAAELKTDYSGFVKTGEGAGEFDGRVLPYEEYTEGDTGVSVRFYLDGGVICGIEMNNGGYIFLMSIKNITNSVPAGVFDLPAEPFDIGSILDAFMNHNFMGD
jgi:predicted small secreted protein